MILLGCQKVSKSYHARPLFRDLSLTISEGDRLGVIGPNGAGKSTLLRLMAGLEEPDAGTITKKSGLRTAYVPQAEDFPGDQTVLALTISMATSVGVDPDEAEFRAKIILGQVGFTDFEQMASRLSGGWRKRLALARGFVQEPDVLLLDEPTNHLDIESIFWLEKFLQNAPFPFAMISHDRAFLERTVNRVAEVDAVYPDGVFVAPGAYSDFLQKRSDWLSLQQRLEETLANKARREIEWLRRAPQARATKAKYRIDEAHELIGELGAVRGRLRGQGAGTAAKLDFVTTGRKTKRLVDAQAITKKLGERMIVKNLSLVLTGGLNLGILGGNGTGKTTLLRLLKKEMEPDSGKVLHADNLKIVYFDQTRAGLDFNQTLKDALTGGGGDGVNYRGTSIHYLSWGRRFLFRPEQMELFVHELSGGEQARVLIARMMLEPADVLLLDEPTNDLDLPTLEVLEESLAGFPGAVVLVSHDRYFLDQVCDAMLGLDGDGGAALYADCQQWERDLKARAAAERETAAAAREDTRKTSTGTTGGSSRKLSYNDQREWDQMEAKIMKAEAALETAQAAVDDPALASSAVKLAAACAAAEKAQQDVEALYARWAELEAKLK